MNPELARVATIREAMVAAHPFWGHLLLQVEVLAAPELPSFAATDCVRHIWINPGLTQTLSLRELGFVIAHELGHQVFLSRERSADRDPHLWNCATDYAINRIVAAIEDPERPGRPLYDPPDRILLDAAYDGLVAEAIYQLLDESGLADPVAVHPVLPVDDLEVAPPGCADHGGGIDIHLPGGLSEADRAELRQRVAEAVERARLEGGDLPGTELRSVSPQPAVVDWRTRLAALFQPLGRAPTEFDRTRVRHRWVPYGAVLPRLRGSGLHHVVVAVDTSGSMTPDDLAQVLAEIRALAPLTSELTVVVADARIQEVLDVDEALARLEGGTWKGGGGTDHRPVFQWIARRGLVPDVFVGLTDLFTKLPPQPPPYPVVWVLPARHGDIPWGQAVRVGLACPDARVPSHLEHAPAHPHAGVHPHRSPAGQRRRRAPGGESSLRYALAEGPRGRLPR